jgi:hypothetical protein
MTRRQKIRRIRQIIEDALPTTDYLERERLIREWMPYPIPVLEESLDAGFASPVGNPFVDPALTLADAEANGHPTV